jgi:hypothetical protein
LSFWAGFRIEPLTRPANLFSVRMLFNGVVNVLWLGGQALEICLWGNHGLGAWYYPGADLFHTVSVDAHARRKKLDLAGDVDYFTNWRVID